MHLDRVPYLHIWFGELQSQPPFPAGFWDSGSHARRHHETMYSQYWSKILLCFCWTTHRQHLDNPTACSRVHAPLTWVVSWPSSFRGPNAHILTFTPSIDEFTGIKYHHTGLHWSAVAHNLPYWCWNWLRTTDLSIPISFDRCLCIKPSLLSVVQVVSISG